MNPTSAFDSVGLAWGSRSCISNTFPDDADWPGDHTLGTTPLEYDLLLNTINPLLTGSSPADGALLEQGPSGLSLYSQCLTYFWCLDKFVLST